MEFLGSKFSVELLGFFFQYKTFYHIDQLWFLIAGIKILPLVIFLFLFHTQTNKKKLRDKEYKTEQIWKWKPLLFCTNAIITWWLFKRNIRRKWVDISKISDTNGSNSFFYIYIPDFKSWLSTWFNKIQYTRTLQL